MSDAAYVICALTDIPSRGRGLPARRGGRDGEPKPFPIVVVRWGKQVFGYLNQLPASRDAISIGSASSFSIPTACA